MKSNSKIFKGIEYVQLNQLPEEQHLKLKETINRNLLIKILIDGKVISNCILFKDYEFWYDSVFMPTSITVNASSKQKAETETADLGV